MKKDSTSDLRNSGDCGCERQPRSALHDPVEPAARPNVREVDDKVDLRAHVRDVSEFLDATQHRRDARETSAVPVAASRSDDREFGAVGRPMVSKAEGDRESDPGRPRWSVPI